ncbi:cell division protein ZapA [Paucilactobacillus nenjiangensis]|jgi:cell division protein ZapA|uniref:Cell division protein ZapA n=1 Tax=Paucilactobacillus nenjiangensis TaxID=1296540 RepID=A0A5P1X1N3_9LACO|nr:cell division protein ZapA [Paucilactobacillus nenjiangensis]QER67820.1 cell division protein ZapA [Paucilactobacillus nenjiangensis]
MNRRYKINLDGQDYTISGPGEPDLIVAAQNLVNEQINHLKEVNPKLDDVQRANLVAFNAVADQIKMQKDLDISKDNQ